MSNEGIGLFCAAGLIGFAAVGSYFGWRRLGGTLLDGVDCFFKGCDHVLDFLIDRAIPAAANGTIYGIGFICAGAAFVIAGAMIGIAYAVDYTILKPIGFGRKFLVWFFTSPEPVPLPPVRKWLYAMFKARAERLGGCTSIPQYFDCQNPPQSVPLNKSDDVVVKVNKIDYSVGKVHKIGRRDSDNTDGSTRWFDEDGKLHREDGPAVLYMDGSGIWYKHGQCHREDGPAIEWADGRKVWYLDGVEVPEFGMENGNRYWHNAERQLHREGGPAYEYANGDKAWYKEGKLHREGDLPAIEYADGRRAWCQNGEYHREGGPAATFPVGTEIWYKHNQIHREDGPAIQHFSGIKQWYLDGVEVPEFAWEDGCNRVWYDDKGLFHRKDGPAVEYGHGGKMWYNHGRLHRENGPAVERTDGSREWWQNDQLHRDGGPAIEYADGIKQWFVNGKRHRVGGPAVIHSDGSEEWFVNNKRVHVVPIEVLTANLRDRGESAWEEVRRHHIPARVVSDTINASELKWIAFEHVPRGNWQARTEQDSHNLWECLVTTAKQISENTSDIAYVVKHWMFRAVEEDRFLTNMHGISGRLGAYDMMRFCLFNEYDFMRHGKGCLPRNSKEADNGQNSGDNARAPVDGQVL